MTAPSRYPRPVDPAALTRLVFEDFALDLASGALHRRGEPVDLEPQPTKVLRHLALHAGDVVLREDLHRLLWGEDTHVEADQGLNYCIKELRRALGDSARNPRYIETLTRRGYRFLPSVELAGPADPDGDGTADATPETTRPVPALVVAPSAAADSPAGAGGPSKRAWTGFALATLTVAGVLAVGWLSGWLSARFNAGPPAADSGDAVDSAGPAAAVGPQRIAVLPFDSADGLDEDQAVARQLASQLVSDLVGSTGPGFEVIASTTSFAYQDAGKTIGQIGRELGVSYVVEGVFLRNAGPDPARPGGDPPTGSTGSAGPTGPTAPTARLCVRLVDTREEVVVWTSTYTVTAGQLDALPEVVSQEMAATLLPPV